MRRRQCETCENASPFDRRSWLKATAASALGGGLAGWPPPSVRGAPTDDPPQPDAQPDAKTEAALNDVRRRLTEARIGPLSTVQSARYVAVGDAAEGFMRLILADCEQLGRDYLRHFQLHKFPVHTPDGRLIVVIFQDDRSFRRFFHLPAGIGPPALAGLYDRKTNALHVFDWRNVPMASRASFQFIHTLSHEGTHQLTFNTGLLRRDGDVPLCIIEGFGAYGEARQTSGRSDLGRLNLERMDDLARRQRQVPWIPLRELLTQDQILRNGSIVRVLLAYAQSWLLVHYLMQVPEVVPRFRNYLKAIYPRKTADHRLEDAKAHLGDLDKLDADLRGYAVQLQMSAP